MTNYPTDPEFYGEKLKFSSMDIYARQGTRVVFKGNGGWDNEAPNAIKDGLVVGGVYTVSSTEVGSWSSDVYFSEFPSKGFNTVMFVEESEVKQVCMPEDFQTQLREIDAEIKALQAKRKALLEQVKG